MNPTFVYLPERVDLGGGGSAVRLGVPLFADPWLEAERVRVLPGWAEWHRDWNEWWDCFGPVGGW